MLIDTHCHLDYVEFDGQREEVLARAKDEGVDIVLNPGTDVESSRKVVALADRFESVYAAVGVHPNFAEGWNANSTDELIELGKHPKVVAIGEIGLDFYRDTTPAEKQIEIFESQLDLARELDLPVIIHNRLASEDVIRMLSEWQSSLEADGLSLAERPGVLHSFSGDKAISEMAVRQNYRMGLTGPLTFKNAPELQKAASELPLERLLIETDSPFLSPHPHRGKRNEPGRVKIVAEKLAKLIRLSFEEIAQVTTANALSLFKLEVAVR